MSLLRHVDQKALQRAARRFVDLRVILEFRAAQIFITTETPEDEPGDEDEPDTNACDGVTMPWVAFEGPDPSSGYVASGTVCITTETPE